MNQMTSIEKIERIAILQNFDWKSFESRNAKKAECPSENDDTAIFRLFGCFVLPPQRSDVNACFFMEGVLSFCLFGGVSRVL